MLQQIIIKSETGESLKPLVEIAIQNQLKSLQHGIKRTKERLAAFEGQFGMKSAEYVRRLKVGEITENLDTIDWFMEIEALRLLEEQYHSLYEASID
jgi:hypothetical protein